MIYAQIYAQSMPVLHVSSPPASRQAFVGKRQFLAKHLCLLRVLMCALVNSVLLSLLFTGQAVAKAPAAHQSLTSLTEMARSFLQEQASATPENTVEIQLGRLDSRLRLTRCEKDLTAFLPAGSTLQGKLTVGVQCTDAKPWTVYIPANIRIFTDVFTTARPISRGDMITADDVIARRMDISKLSRGYYRQMDDIIGKLAARSLAAGTALSPRMLKAPLLVRRGDDITIIASVGALQVRSKGKALQNAALGERISVRNTRSKRIIEGVAIRAGIIQVQM